MINVIIGTAGHVDHGKTCLIKALSGIDTDRLKEEKKRGITIENGYAFIKNDKNIHIGIIDVPGHEKFVKNMLAGIGGIDIVLLIISLEEGIKQQTIEHFEIIKSLGIKKGIIVYTKLDSENKVDFNNLKTQVKDLVKGSFLENAKEIPVSSFIGTNIDLLKETIFEYAKDISIRKDNKELTRLPIDRVFTMEGFGTVITGTLMEGKIDLSDELMLYPSMKMVKVRGIESHKDSVPAAFAGQRTAINLSNIKKEEIERGEILAAKDSMLLSNIIDTKLTMFKSITKDIKNAQKVHFNFGSNQVLAQIRIVDGDIKTTSYAQFKFEKGIAIKRGDRFIIRNISPQETSGGGVVLNISSKKLGDSLNKKEYFASLDSGDNNKVLYEIIISSSNEFPNISILSKKLGESKENTELIVKKLQNDKLITTNDNMDFVISNKYYEGIKKYVIDVLSKFHGDNKLAKGISKENFKSLLFKRYNSIGDTNLEKLLLFLVSEKVIKIDKDVVALFSFKVFIDNKNSKEISLIEKKYKDAGFELPSCMDIIKEFGKDKIKKGASEEKQIIVNLAKDGILIKLDNDYYIHKDNYDKAINAAKDILNKKGTMKLPELRDALGTSRKYAILLADYFDKIHFTKFINDYRILYNK